MTSYTFSDLGWSGVFQSQLSLEDIETYDKARISAVHRARLEALTQDGAIDLIPSSNLTAGMFAVGDWVLFDREGRAVRILERKTRLARSGAGLSGTQLIAANVDTLAIVSSCNADFNPARLERYLVLASAAGCLPLVILTKADLCEDADDYRRQAERLSPLITALALDARDPDDLTRLSPWTGPGETLALVGSSGVGKTTLLNGLTGVEEATQGIREDDAKGRHTTTYRMMMPVLNGGWIIDTPGMRELGLTDAQEGLEAVFEDIEALARQCRFSDCTHNGEPGCAIQAAMDSGELDPDRLARMRKLERENAFPDSTYAERRAHGKSRQKLYNGGKARSKHKRRIG